MQDNKECCSSRSNRSVMVLSCHNKPAGQELSSPSRSSDGGGGGPMFYSASNHVACFGDINDVVASMSASGSAATDAIAASKTLQYPYFNTDSSLFTFNSSGEMTSVNERVLFTAAQWQELERQTTIYKYMVASVPVPPELLIPINKNLTDVVPSQSNIVLTGSLEPGIPSCNSSDLEPWRCKRTDGKKWRCSRDVAPDQKYCERHSHKSRSRSRKPVESHTHDFPRTMTMTNTINNHDNYSTNPPLFNQKPHFSSPLFMFPGAMASSVTSYDQPRSLEWLLKGETSPVASNSSQEWQHLKIDSIKGDDKVSNFHREEQFSSNTYRGGHSLQGQRLNDHCSMLLSPTSTTLERALNPSQTQAQVTRHFIDTWSTNSGRDNIGGICKKSYVSSSEKLPLPHSTLTLSMSSGKGRETNNEGKGSAQLGSSGIMETSDKDHQSVSGLRPQWMMMSHGGSWMGSPPGGPLAEALCLGISSNAKTASNLASHYSSSCGPNDSKN